MTYLFIFYCSLRPLIHKILAFQAKKKKKKIKNKKKIKIKIK